METPAQPVQSEPATTAAAPGSFRPVLSLWALVLFGLAFVGPTAPYTFFGVGSVKSHGHFALVYLIGMFAVSFPAVSYGRMAAAFAEGGSPYAYASRALPPAAGYLAGWVMIAGAAAAVLTVRMAALLVTLPVESLIKTVNGLPLSEIVVTGVV